MEQDEDIYGDAMRVNAFDVLAVLLRAITGFFGIVAGMFQGFAILAQSHSDYADGQRIFHMKTAQDIERLTGGK